MKIEIKNYKPVSKGALRGNFDIFFPNAGMSIRGCSYFIKNNKEWFTFPSRAYEKDGQKKYYSYVFFEEEKMKKLQEEAIPLIRKEHAATGVMEEEELPF